MIGRGWLFLGFLAGCAPEEVQSDCTHDPPLSYASFGQGFMTSYCTGCHHSLLPDGQREGAPMGVDLDTYADVQQWAERIVARVETEENPMPPGGGPRADEIVNIREWIACKVADDIAAGEQP